MSLRATSWAWTVSTSPTCKLVLLALADHADEVGHCWPGSARIIEMTGLSERAVRIAIGGLVEAKAILIDRAGNGRGHSTRYVLCINGGPQRGHDMPGLEEQKAAPDAGFVPVKGASAAGKGARRAGKGAPRAPEPSRTVINQVSKKEVALRAPEPSVTIPEWMPLEAWGLYCRHRERIGKKLWTADAAILTIRDLGKFRDEGMDPAAVLEQSVANGWRGVFPLKNRPKQAPGKLDWWINDMKSGAIGR